MRLARIAFIVRVLKLKRKDLKQYKIALFGVAS